MKPVRVLCVILVLALLCGCTRADSTAEMPAPAAKTPELVFQAGRHDWNSGYKQAFDTRYTDLSEVVFHMHTALFEPEPADALIKRVVVDLDAIQAVFESDTRTDIYVVKETLKGSVYAAPGELVCTAADIETGAYRGGLISAMLSLTEPWQGIGASALVFDGGPNNSELAAYYANNENLPVLTLFAAYFNDTFTDEPTRTIAEQTAASFTAYLMEHGGQQMFQDCKLSDQMLRQDWLDSIGVSMRYTPPCDVSWLDGARYSELEAWPLVVTLPDQVYYFSIIKGELETAGDVLQFAANNVSQLNAIFKMIEEQAPKAFAQITALSKRQLAFYFDQGISVGEYRSGSFGSSAVCSSISDAIHEAIHSSIPVENYTAKLWVVEGLCEYFPNTVHAPRVKYYQSLTMNPDFYSGDDKTFIELMQNYYIERAGYPESVEDLDGALFFEAITVTFRSHPELDVTIPFVSASMYQNKSRGNSPMLGSELTNADACLFTAYLIDAYGLEAVIAYAMDAELGFTNAFGEQYESALAAFYEGIDNG